jgi:hypothetical protein
MPLMLRARAGHSVAKQPANRAAQGSDGKQGHERVLLHGPTHSLGALLVVALGLRQVPPALLHVGLTAPVETVSKIRGLVDRRLDAVVSSAVLEPLARRCGYLVQRLGLTFGSDALRC